MADAVLIGAEAVVVAAWGAVTGAGRATAVVWVADRPRRRRVRTVRRRRWWRRGKWWRLLIGLELVGVGAWVGARSAARVLRATPTVATAAAAGARDGWRTGRDRARARRQPPTTPAGTDRADEAEVVDAEVLCSWAGCTTVLTPDDPGPYCLVHATTSGAAAVTATATSTTATEPDPAPGSESGSESGPDVRSGPASAGPDPVPQTSRPGRSAVPGVSVVWSEDFEAYAAGRIDAGQIRCVLCGQAPCACPPFGSPEYFALVDRLHHGPARSAGPHDQHGQSDGPGHLAGPDTDVQEDDMSKTSEMTITSGAGPATVTGRAGVGGQLTAVGDLIAEVAQLQAWTEAGLTMLGDLEDWAAGLPDQVAGADWGTEAVTAAAIGLSEARTITEVRDRITVLLAAAAEAARLGEQLAAGGARGDVAGLRPQ